MMAGIKGRNTRPELIVRSSLHQAGFRYRLHDKRLPGRPDIVLPKWRAIIQVQGCFWHKHEGCRFATSPQSNREFWSAKLAQNVQRDQRDIKALMQLGWRVALVWECSLRSGRTELTIEELATWIVGGSDWHETLAN
jgi:DNA mismatch endonuclease (patch repair protein)